MSTERFELKIIKDKDGSDTELSSMSLSESKAFIVLLDSVINLTENLNLGKDCEIKIEKGSACVAVEGPSIKPLFNEYNKILNNESKNVEVVQAFRNIQNLFLQNGIEYQSSFISNNFNDNNVYDRIVKSKSFKTKSIRKRKNIEIVFLKGYLQEIGGRKPNFHILSNGKNIKIECTIEQAQRVKNDLYKEIYIGVLKRFNSNSSDYTFIDKYSNKETYKENKILIDSIYNDSKINAVRYFNNYLTNVLKEREYLKVRSILKLINFEFMDSNILKSALIITKSFTDNTNINDLRTNIRTILEKKRGSQLI